MRYISILGSTGTIGLNTLEVIDLHPERFSVFALTARQNVQKMFAQCQQYQPRYAVMYEENAAEQLDALLKQTAIETIVLSGEEGLIAVASHAETDYVMAGIVGAAGLLSTMAAAKAGKRILLANKESLVMTGSLLMEAVDKYQAELLPVDSEHNAIFQCLPQGYRSGQICAELSRIILTASGGAFRDWPIEKLIDVTPEQACTHPNWVMGRKITVDSATMMNKGLELIEAKWLFNVPSEKIEVLLHPQSIIHSMVEFVDGSTLAQLGLPDMRVPIAYSLSWPIRFQSGVSGIDLLKVGRLDFKTLDLQRYPCLRLAKQALDIGETATTILNAANEVAVQAFLDSRIKFTDIPRLIENVMSNVSVQKAKDIQTVLECDKNARSEAERQLSDLSVLSF